MTITSLRDLIATNFNNMLLSPDSELTIQSFTFLHANNQPTGKSYAMPGEVGNITITGDNFNVNTKAVVNNNEVDTVFLSNTSLRIATPTLGAGSWPTYVYHGDYISNLLNLEYGSEVRTWNNFTTTYNIPAGEQISVDLKFVSTLKNDTATYSIVQAGTTIPAGLNLSSSGVLSGNVSVANTGSYSLQIRSQVGTGQTTDANLTINVFQRTGVPVSFEIEPIYKSDSYLYPSYFDKSSASQKYYSRTSNGSSFASACMKISANGRKMISCGSGQSTFFLFELTNPYDPTSAVLIHTCPVLDANTTNGARDFCVSDDGLTLYVLNTSYVVRIYSLNNYWDISSIGSLLGSFNASTLAANNQIWTIALSKDNTLLIGSTNVTSWYGYVLNPTTKLNTGSVFVYTNVPSAIYNGVASIYLEQTPTVTSSTRLFYVNGAGGYIGQITGIDATRSVSSTNTTVAFANRLGSTNSGLCMTPDGKSFYFGTRSFFETSGSAGGGIAKIDATITPYLVGPTNTPSWSSTLVTHLEDILPRSLFPLVQNTDNRVSLIVQSGANPNNQLLVVYDNLGVGDAEYKNNAAQTSKDPYRIYSSTTLSPGVTAAIWANSGYLLYLFDNNRKELTSYSTTVPYNFDNSILIESFAVAASGRVNSIFASINGKVVYLNAEYDGIYKITFESYNRLSSFAKINTPLAVGSTSILYSNFNFGESGEKLFFVQQNTTTGGQPAVFQTKFLNLLTPWDLSSAIADPYLFCSGASKTAVAFNEAAGKSILFDQPIDSRFLGSRGNIYNDVNEYFDDTYRLPLVKVSYGDDITFNVATNIWLDSTGKRLYIIDSGIFYQMELTEIWDLSTMKFVNKTGTLVSSATGLYISDDGYRLYTIDSSSDLARHYSFAIPWDITSLELVETLSVAAQDTVPTDITFKPDGTIMYLVGTTDDNVDQYLLSTPWNLSTRVLSSTTSLAVSNPLDIEFNNDGTIMFCVTSGAINTFTLSTAWDTTTAVLTSSKNLAGDNNDVVVGMHISNSGSTLVTVDSTNDKMSRYTMSTPWSIATIAFEENYAGSDTSTGSSAFCFANNKQYMFVVDTNEGIVKYELTTPGDINTVIFKQKSDTLQFNEDTTIDRIFVNDAGTKLYIFGQLNDSIYEYTFSGQPFDLDTLSFSQSFILSAQTITVAAGLFFNKDGTRYYVLNQTADILYQYDTITPWSVISPTMSASLTVTAQDATPRAMRFNETGTKLYYYGSSNRRLHIYTLSTPWNISSVTASSSTNAIWFDLAKGDTTFYTDMDIDEQNGYIYMFSNKAKLAKYKMIGF